MRFKRETWSDNPERLNLGHEEHTQKVGKQ